MPLINYYITRKGKEHLAAKEFSQYCRFVEKTALTDLVYS